jgi:hypothetical protein
MAEKKLREEEIDRLTLDPYVFDFYKGKNYDTSFRERVARENISPLSTTGANLLFLDMLKNRGGRNVAQAASQLFAPVITDPKYQKIYKGGPMADLSTTYRSRYFKYGTFNSGEDIPFTKVDYFMDRFGKGIQKKLKAVDKTRASEMGLSSRDAGLSSLVKRKKSKLEEEKQEQASLV